jgi:hypothetical protein
VLTSQCAQLDEANRAWQEFHQAQINTLCTKLNDWITIDASSSLEQIADQMIYHMASERQNMIEKYDLLEKTIDELQINQQSNINRQERIKEQYENELNEKKNLIDQMQCRFDTIREERDTQTIGK